MWPAPILKCKPPGPNNIPTNKKDIEAKLSLPRPSATVTKLCLRGLQSHSAYKTERRKLRQNLGLSEGHTRSIACNWLTTRHFAGRGTRHESANIDISDICIYENICCLCFGKHEGLAWLQQPVFDENHHHNFTFTRVFTRKRQAVSLASLLVLLVLDVFFVLLVFISVPIFVFLVLVFVLLFVLLIPRRVALLLHSHDLTPNKRMNVFRR